ncbi:hypothetical protein N0V83_005377 [Neocucurbitaria cava]|uniref:Uncharacterized protein n=1 Tax=Neocucurbitaria cava TaxID=798079 RepID=A0A9W8Y6Y3_9PLEO|nr:hypothetical protein N0V83_005377 [Neocucurbitaria cava]
MFIPNLPIQPTNTQVAVTSVLEGTIPTILLGGLVMGFAVVYYSIRKKKEKKPRQAQQTMRHGRRRGSSSAYPPGLQIDKVLENWETVGMEEPFFIPDNRRGRRE